MDRERHPFAPSRRHLGALLASAAAVAVPALSAIAAPQDADAELIALETKAYHGQSAARAILAERIEPREADFERLLRSGQTQIAFAYGRTYDRDGWIAAADAHFERMDLAIEAAFAMPAKSAAGRAAKVRMLVRHYFGPLREPFNELDYEHKLLRLLLAEYAGMSPDDFAAI